MISEQENWQNYFSKCKKYTVFTRYAFGVSDESTLTECKHLLATHSMPYECKEMDYKSFNECGKNEWSRDL